MPTKIPHRTVRAYLGWSGLAFRLVHLYMKWLYFSLFDHHITNSHYTADELPPVSIGHPIQRGVWVRPMGVDCRGLSPALRCSAARQSLLKRVAASDTAVLLLYVGRLVPEKNLALLIDAIAALKNQREREWRLMIVGEGNWTGAVFITWRSLSPWMRTLARTRPRPSRISADLRQLRCLSPSESPRAIRYCSLGGDGVRVTVSRTQSRRSSLLCHTSERMDRSAQGRGICPGGAGSGS